MSRMTQCASLLSFLEQTVNEWVPLYLILSLGIAQYNARIFELRREGHKIENKTEHVDGRVHSYFRLVKEPLTKKLFEG
jgi:hypothetical protein